MSSKAPDQTLLALSLGPVRLKRAESESRRSQEPKQSCHCCGGKAGYSILLAGEAGHFYLPNQTFREHELGSEVWFCQWCMRRLDDSFRATVLYLRSEPDPFSRTDQTP